MTIQSEPEVKDVDTVYIDPADKDAEDIDEPEATDPESSQEETEGSDEDDSKKPDEIVKKTIPPKDIDTSHTDEGDGLANVEGETPRERALRAEVTRLKSKARGEQGAEIFGQPSQAPIVKKEIDPEKAAILGKYKPEEISSLREVFPVLAEEMGFVNKNALEGQSYSDKAQEALDTFLEKHPEYTVENDQDGTLWGAFKTEFALYKQPSNPKDFPKIFDRVHRDVFGIKPAGALKTVNAQVEKVKTASHSGSSPANTAPQKRATAANTGAYRLDMLKGFTDEEKAELGG